MKLFTVACSVLLISLSVHAGRESHGFMPGAEGFVCALPGSDKPAMALSILNRKVDHATLSLSNQSIVEFHCVDHFDSHKLDSNLRLTVVCTQPQSNDFRMELRESQSAAEISVFYLAADPKSINPQIFPCQ